MAPLADFLLAVIPFSNVPYSFTHYVAGDTPITNPVSVGAALVAYLAVVFGLQYVVKNQPPMKLHNISQAHNLFLSTGSGILLLLILEEILPLWWKHGLFNALCNENSWTPRLEFYYMINYYTKYVELLDTVFLVLKKKKLIFLHVFHHSATALLCYTQLNGRTSISWVPITLNLSVHVVMYYYYYASAGGAKIWWKQYVTTMQIGQFFIDLIAVYFGFYSAYATAKLPGWPTMGTCAGSPGAAYFGCAILTSYFYLFIDFYMRTYKKKAGSTRPAASKVATQSKAAANADRPGYHTLTDSTGKSKVGAYAGVSHKLD